MPTSTAYEPGFVQDGDERLALNAGRGRGREGDYIHPASLENPGTASAYVANLRLQKKLYLRASWL